MKKKDNSKNIRKDCEKFIDESIGACINKKAKFNNINPVVLQIELYNAYIEGRRHSVVKSPDCFPPSWLVTEANNYINNIIKNKF